MADLVEDLQQQVEGLRKRLVRHTEAMSQITASLEFDSVLKGVLDGARSLTGARYGSIFALDDSGALQLWLTSGLTPRQHEQFDGLAEGPALLAHLREIEEPRRFDDFHDYTESAGFAGLRLPLPMTGPVMVLMAPLYSGSSCVGGIYLAGSETGAEFQKEDEEALSMFASRAEMVLANARRYRDEQRARAELATLVDTSPVGVAVLDANTGSAVLLNSEARRIVRTLGRSGARAEDLLELVTVRRADGSEMSLGELPVAEALRDADTVRLEEIVLTDPDGASVAALINVTPIRSPEGAVETVVVTLQDLEHLEKAARLRADFLALVSHELRAPLAAVKGSAATLLESDGDLEPAERHEFHRIIGEHADDMRRLIGDLLDVARIRTGTLPVAPEPVSVGVVIDEARNRFARSRGGDNLRIELPPGLPAVLADRRRIGQVLDNLLSNAAKFSPPAAPILLTAAVDGAHVAISVRDEGRGMAAEDLPKLFGKFVRSDPHAAYDGYGLGLAICKGIVEAHGGRIWARSDGPGLGTLLAFTVPAVQTDDDIPLSPIASDDRPSNGQRQQRVLAVDDDPRALKRTRDALAEAGYLPIVTVDPDEVPRLVKSANPDLVLLDLMLADADGIDVMRRILALADLPVIFVSAFGQSDVVAHALDAGAVDYIVKPFSSEELAARIRVALHQRLPAHRADPPEPYTAGELTIDHRERRVTLAGSEVRLTATEYNLLVELSARAGAVVTHQQLLRRVWNQTGPTDLRPMRTAIKSLRRKLGDSATEPTYISTEPRVGYRMRKP